VNRIRVVLAIARGYTVSELALIFMLDGDTIRRYIRLYKESGINGLLEIHYNGRPSYLTDEQKEKLKEHLCQTIYLEVKSIVEYVNAVFKVKYSIPGMTKLLHELNFVYKKPNIHPSEADAEVQRKWVLN
jgi:transposase